MVAVVIDLKVVEGVLGSAKVARVFRALWLLHRLRSKANRGNFSTCRVALAMTAGSNSPRSCLCCRSREANDLVVSAVGDGKLGGTD